MSDEDVVTVSATAPVDALSRLRAAGQRAVLVTVTVDGVRPGVVVTGPDGRPQAATVRDPALRDAAVALARSALADPAERVRRIEHPDRPGAEAELVAEVCDPEPAVLVLGATDTARALVRLVRALPARATLLSPGGAVDVPGGAEVRADDPARVLLAAPPGPDDVVVVCDVAAAWALEAIRVALASEAVFVGAVADDAAAVTLRRTLTDAGVPGGRLARLHAPVGVPADAAEPGEVALAALAAAVAARRGRSG